MLPAPVILRIVGKKEYTIIKILIHCYCLQRNKTIYLEYFQNKRRKIKLRKI